MGQGKFLTIAAAAALALTTSGQALATDVLWWDATPEYGGQAPNALRQEMSDYIDNFNGGSVFSATYVASTSQGDLATHLASNTYDVIVFDSTNNQGSRFNAADLAAVQNHYATKSNLMLDGTLYIRSINYNTGSDFPGINGGTGGLTINQINQLATRGGGIMIGTDHNCCQNDANALLQSVVTGAAFSGSTNPSTDGVFYGNDLLNDAVGIAAADVFNHWDTISSQAIAPTGAFTDVNGNSINLYSQVDVADEPGGGTKFSYISTSWQPGSGTTGVDDTTTGGTAGGGNTGGGGSVPVPSTLLLLGLGSLLLGRKQMKKAA